MLNGIAKCISPELIYNLMRMGHGDKIAFADVDFPGYTYGKNVIRADGVSMDDILAGVIPLFPLDHFTASPAYMMAPAEDAEAPLIWDRFAGILKNHYSNFNAFTFLERFAFYDAVKECFAIVVTGEADGNIILQKGVVNG